MRRNSSTVVVLAGPAPAEVLAAVGRSMNVALIRPAESGPGTGPDALAAASEALQRAGRATSPYALVTADPLAALAASWQEMWDVSRQPVPANDNDAPSLLPQRHQCPIVAVRTGAAGPSSKINGTGYSGGEREIKKACCCAAGHAPRPVRPH